MYDGYNFCTLPETNIAPENQELEDVGRRLYFSESTWENAMSVSVRVANLSNGKSHYCKIHQRLKIFWSTNLDTKVIGEF